jgi:hypothetical protein
MTSPSGRVAQSAGLVVGVAVVALMLAGWRVPGGSKAPGAHVSLTVNRIGEFDVEPFGQLVDVHDLVPGRVAEVRFVVTNVTGTAINLRVRARAADADLDGQLAFRVVTRGTSLFSGTLGQLRVPTRRRLILSPGARLPVLVRVWLPSRARAYRARNAEVSLELRSQAAD